VFHLAHSTHVLRVDDVQVLTDPWFNDPAFGSLVHPWGLPCEVEALADCAMIAITHAHPDHFDRQALDRWPSKRNVQVVVGDAALVTPLQRLGFAQVFKLDDWEQHRLGDLRVHAVPALHDVPQQGFVLEGSTQCIYFAGDTGAHDSVRSLAERYRPTLALLPIDGGRLRGSAVHTLTPSEAVTVAEQLGIHVVCPTHADAVFSDWLAQYVLAEQVQGALAAFQHELAARAPAVELRLPSAGSWMTL
jgi:L-ascorbate metabolism protein UlaG (beta-lactamase superfamily)